MSDKATVKSKVWVEENITDDIQDNFTIAETAIPAIAEQFKIIIPGPELCLAYFGIVFDTIREYLEKNKEKSESVEISIADHIRFQIDDGSSVADDMEDPGTFAFTLYHGGKPDTTLIKAGDIESNTIERCSKWFSTNVQAQTKALKEISANAVVNLRDKINLTIGDEVIVIPLFVSIYDRMISFMENALKVQMTVDPLDDKKSIRFVGRMDVTIMSDPDLIVLKPTVSDKLNTKNDGAKKQIDRDEE